VAFGLGSQLNIKILEKIKSFIKNHLSSKSLIYKILRDFYYYIGAYWRPAYITNYEDIISKYALVKSQNKQEVVFVNIGANDGIVEDPIAKYVKKYHWKGVMVEPVGYLFDRLKQNFRGFPVQFEKSVISTQKGKQSFYRIAQSPNLPSYHERIGSLRKDYLLWYKANIPDLEDYIIQEEVNSLTFNDLTHKYQLDKVQVIVIDAEGSDAQILQSIDLKNIKAELVIFEHIYLGFEEYKKTLLHLRKNAFRSFRVGRDTIAIHYTLKPITKISSI
jgi:FkbM family methyltransferase